MASEAYALGVNTKMWLHPGTTAKAGTGVLTFGATSEPYDFLSESMAKHVITAGAASIRGTRMQHSINRRVIRNEYYGEVQKYISAREFDTLLPKFLGPEAATDTFTGGPTAADEEIPYFSALFQRDSGIFVVPTVSIFRYDDCKIDQFILRGRASQAGEEAEPAFVTATMRIVGCAETQVVLPASLPALPSAAVDGPYVFSDTASGVTLVGTGSRPIQEFIIAVNNHIGGAGGNGGKYVNSLNPYALRCMGRTVQLRIKLPWNDINDDIYGTNAHPAAATAIIVFTNGAYVTTWRFGILTIDYVSPTTRNGKGELEFFIDGTAEGGTYDVQVVNDITP